MAISSTGKHLFSRRDPAPNVIPVKAGISRTTSDFPARSSRQSTATAPPRPAMTTDKQRCRQPHSPEGEAEALAFWADLFRPYRAVLFWNP